MPKGDFTKTKEFIIPLRGVVRDGQLAALLDQSGQEIGMPVTAVESVTGGIELSAAGASFAAGKRRGSTVALLGDSFTARNNGGAGRELDYGYFNWANNFLGRPFRVVLNAGVSGERTDQMLARIDAVVAVKPDWCFVLGGINDVAQGKTVAEIIENLKTICRTLTASSINVVLVSVAPNTQAVGRSTKVRLINKAMREWCMDYSAGVIFADAYSALVNPTSTTGDAATGMLHDSLHPSPKGARALGKAVADTVRPLLPLRNALVSSAADSYDIDNTSKQLLANPLLSGTGGTVSGTGASGTLASGWLGGTSSGTVTSVFSAGQARADGIGVNQRITISSAGSGSAINMRQSNLQSKMAIGDTVYASAHIKATAMSDVKAIYLQGQMTIDGTAKYLWSMEPSGVSPYDQTDLEIVLQTPDLLLAGADLTAFTFSLKVEFGTSGNGACVLEVGRIGLFKK